MSDDPRDGPDVHAIDRRGAGSSDPASLRAHLASSRGSRETVSGMAGVSGAAVVMWLGDLLGVHIDIVPAGVIGGLVAKVIDALLRRHIMRRADDE